MTDLKSKPKPTSSLAEQELTRLDNQFKEFDADVKQMTHDRLSATPKQEIEPQTKLAQSEIAKSKDIYLKPSKAIGSKEKFNENYRDQYNFAKEYVQFIAENKEIIGETIELWTKPFAGVPAEYWEVPCNKPLWGPRYLAERIKGCTYHRMTMQQIATNADHTGQFYGSMAVDSSIQRLDAIPVSQRKSIFMGAANF